MIRLYNHFRSYPFIIFTNMLLLSVLSHVDFPDRFPNPCNLTILYTYPRSEDV